MTSFCDLMTALTRDGDVFKTVVTDDWLQGRTAYGGLSAALCVEAAQRALADLPPLRSAQFTLIGPSAGPLAIVVSTLRRGKSAVFVNVDLTGEAGLAARAVLSFGAARKSALQYSDLPAPSVAPVAESPSFFPAGKPFISFQQHFESRFAGGARPFTPGATPEYRIWFRHTDPKAWNGIVPLIALADAPPPPAMVMFAQPGPISTMTWSLDVLSDAPATKDGWWLIGSKTETSHQGYSTQSMMVWNSDLKPVIAHRQNVAIFV
jgi:acyl-CoA thioesterase